MSRPPEPPLEAMVRTFERAYATSVPFQEDAAIGGALSAEARPVLVALAEAVRRGSADAPPREAYALLTLLSHRAGLLGATPSATFALLDAVLQGLAAGGAAVSGSFRDQLWMVAIEGYSTGRDERVTHELRQAAARAQICVELGPGCLVGFLAGRLDAESVEATLAEVARRLLQRSARGFLLDATRLESEAVEPAARAIAGFVLTATSLGVSCWLAISHPEWRAAVLAAAGSELNVVDTFESGLTECLSAAGLELKPRGWARALFDKAR